MNANIECLTLSLNELKIKYEFVNDEKSMVRVGNAPYFYFSNHIVPLNTKDIADICDDKLNTYRILKDTVRMPKTLGYIDTKAHEDWYRDHVHFMSEEKIIEDVEKELVYPYVLKKNRGFLGINVFLCHDRDEAKKSLAKIFDRDSRDFDYVALAETYIKPRIEYRGVFLDGELMLCYEKRGGSFNRAAGEFKYEIVSGSKAEEIADFIKPMFQVLKLRYAGLDIIENEVGELFLIELNDHPGYNYFIRDNGKAPVVELYKQILRALNL